MKLGDEHPEPPVRIGITASPDRPKALSIARVVHGLLEGRCELFVADDTARALGLPGRPLREFDGDVLIAVGGDGCLFYSAQAVEAPILGINTGGVGFLSEVDPNGAELEGAVERLLSGKYFLEQRMMLSTSIWEERLPDALNDVVVHVKDVARMRAFEILIDSRPVGRLRADGIILSTPTGSTSYALSAGGPVVDPTVDAILVTAIAPFASAGRPLVVGPLKEVTIRLVGRPRSTIAVVDGYHEVELGEGVELKVFKSPRRTSLVRFSTEFFQRLRVRSILSWDGP